MSQAQFSKLVIAKDRQIGDGNDRDHRGKNELPRR